MAATARTPLLLLALLAGLIALAQGAAAQTVADTVTRWGLIGTWAIDCARPASADNAYLAYVVRGAKVVHERDFGGRRDSNDVDQARTGAGGALELVVHFAGLKQTRKVTLIMGPDRRTRAMASARIDGTEETIRGGRFTATGHATPWQSRCQGGWGVTGAGVEAERTCRQGFP